MVGGGGIGGGGTGAGGGGTCGRPRAFGAFGRGRTFGSFGRGRTFGSFGSAGSSEAHEWEACVGRTGGTLGRDGMDAQARIDPAPRKPAQRSARQSILVMRRGRLIRFLDSRYAVGWRSFGPNGSFERPV
jgi:hypothetical protein